ncbi:MAG: hypothetical protein J6W21_05010 [Bacteroidaceae bacterium]|nr:hypothetical protein [Bacteroidaceae bacterium]
MRTIILKLLSKISFPSIEGGVRGGSLLLLILLAPFTASAQKVIAQDLESWMSSLITQAIDNKVVVDKNLGQERDIQREGNPLKWRCDILTFTLSKKQRSMLEDMIRAFEENGHHNPNCYGINSKRTGTSQTEGKRNLMIGDDPNNYVTIGENYGNYLNVNILDATDTTKTHRYAYALEWKEDRKGNAFVRYIVTYAKIPSAFTSYNATVKYPSVLDWKLPKEKLQQAENKAKAWYLKKDKKGKITPININEQFMEANNEAMASYLDFLKSNRADSVLVKRQFSLSNGDTVFVVTRELINEDGVWQPKDAQDAVNDMLCNDNVLLMFSNLKQYYNNHQNAELTAISIYTLCRHANAGGFFTDPRSVEELEQMMRDVDKLIENAKTETDRKYFKMALYQLDQIQKKRK